MLYFFPFSIAKFLIYLLYFPKNLLKLIIDIISTQFKPNRRKQNMFSITIRILYKVSVRLLVVMTKIIIFLILLYRFFIT